jgi:hypothetical protein
MRAMGALSVLFLCLAIGCGDDDGRVIHVDAGPPARTDAGGGVRDAGPVVREDAGGGTDAGMITRPDAGRPDAGMVVVGEGAVGDACTGAGDCATGMCTTMIGTPPISFALPGGYCSATCTGTGMSTCGEGAECADVFVGMYCLKTCESDADCREAERYSCDTLPAFGGGGGGKTTYCLPPLPI